VIQRAKEILENLESGQWDETGHPRLAPSRKAGLHAEEQQLTLFPAAHPVAEDIQRLNLSEMTPLEALNKLQELQERLRKKG
jgi:DNA mismatch repair protein MutS